MDNIIFAKFDIDSGFVQAWTEDCNLILIDCDAVEKAFTDNMYQRSQLDYLIYNDPMGYAKMVWEALYNIPVSRRTAAPDLTGPIPPVFSSNFFRQRWFET